eukprot:TRINITY_DN1509_c0_g1_i1.p1 TRINITY_DN1509_c0_g1~~TRINITY_DN1509_c0_g1_i1.p1  ORF type:complete len:313 (+),score=86.83 TRINITY_DN1509_c0_g1_i1:54-941(+)
MVRDTYVPWMLLCTVTLFFLSYELLYRKDPAGGTCPAACYQEHTLNIPTHEVQQQQQQHANPRGLAEVPVPIRTWITDHARLGVPTIVSVERRALTLDIAYYILSHNIPGDFVETGVFTGGSTILLMKALQEWNNVPEGVKEVQRRKLWAADSFDGLPPPSDQDKEGTVDVGFRGQFNSTLDSFIYNMKSWGAYDESRLKILKGWFSETLHVAGIDKISYLRLDGDLYESTRDAITPMYHKISKGGIVYVDDYFTFNGCKKAIDEFREKNGVNSTLYTQYFPEGRGYEAVWWFVE